ncbi:MAG: hypothetical protein UY97_C0002G0005 [Parcubacteria group bacterium GW2011_GWB1_57_6]|nr:MAG: hypothetical protein UY97_C0002G0005 [Parcubacteria group bacterium GW2011_GWB1_57_6]
MNYHRGYTQHQSFVKNVGGVRTTKMLSRRGFGAGYTLIELVVAVGLFALIMTLASGAYLVMIGVNQQSQGIATGINNLSFALETMTRAIRTGTNYSCGGGDCTGGTNFSVLNASGATMTYLLSGGVITQNGVALTDSSVQISSLKFYASGTAGSDSQQPRVTIVVSGTVPGKAPQQFTVETGATMRGSDI